MKILNIEKCSRNFEFEKQTDQNFITQNRNRIFEEKETAKTANVKRSLYLNIFLLHILAYFIFWIYILAGGEWRWVVLDIIWVVLVMA